MWFLTEFFFLIKSHGSHNSFIFTGHSNTNICSFTTTLTNLVSCLHCFNDNFAGLNTDLGICCILCISARCLGQRLCNYLLDLDFGMDFVGLKESCRLLNITPSRQLPHWQRLLCYQCGRRLGVLGLEYGNRLSSSCHILSIQSFSYFGDMIRLKLLLLVDAESWTTSAS